MNGLRAMLEVSLEMSPPPETLPGVIEAAKRVDAEVLPLSDAELAHVAGGMETAEW